MLEDRVLRYIPYTGLYTAHIIKHCRWTMFYISKYTRKIVWLHLAEKNFLNWSCVHTMLEKCHCEKFVRSTLWQFCYMRVVLIWLLSILCVTIYNECEVFSLWSKECMYHSTISAQNTEIRNKENNEDAKTLQHYLLRYIYIHILWDGGIRLVCIFLDFPFVRFYFFLHIHLCREFVYFFMFLFFFVFFFLFLKMHHVFYSV